MKSLSPIIVGLVWIVYSMILRYWDVLSYGLLLNGRFLEVVVAAKRFYFESSGDYCNGDVFS